MVELDYVYAELKEIHKEIEKNNALLLSIIPEEKISARELARLKTIKNEMDSGKSSRYSKGLF